MKPLSLTQRERMERFFTEDVSMADFAHTMRQFAHATILLNFEVEHSGHEKEIENGYWLLNQFLERIDPYLNKKDKL